MEISGRGALGDKGNKAFLPMMPARARGRSDGSVTGVTYPETHAQMLWGNVHG
jgi:hypothetical protein